MVPFGLDMNLLPVMGGMGTSSTKHSNRCVSPRFLCRALDVSLFLSRVFGGRERCWRVLKTALFIYLFVLRLRQQERWFVVHELQLAMGGGTQLFQNGPGSGLRASGAVGGEGQSVSQVVSGVTVKLQIH